MTCVVGVLMIIMIISQVLVRGQGRPVANNEEQQVPPLPQVEQADVNTKESELEQLQAELEKIRSQWGVLEADYPGHQSKVDKLTEDIRRLRESMPLDDENIPGKVESARTLKAQLDGRQKELLKQIKEERSKSMQLQKQYNARPKVTEIALTETRIVPTELNAVRFVCRHGRIYRMDSNEIGQAIGDAFKKIAAGITSSAPESERIDRLLNYFKEHDVGNNLFRVKVTYSPIGPFKRFIFSTELRSNTQGETVEELLSMSSKFRSAVSRIKPDKEYIVFSVWADSFDTYIAAQQVAENIYAVEGQYRTKIGMSWVAYDFDEEIMESWIPGVNIEQDKNTTIKNTM